MNRFSPRQRLLLLALFLLAFALRLYRLGADSLWYDETVSALLAAKPLPAMWAHTAGDIHPPLYYALLHFWTTAAGNNEYSLAFFSLWFGLALVPLIAYLGLRLYGPRAALLAAFLAAINPFAIWYSQEVRMYTLGACLLLLILLLVLAYLHRSGRSLRLLAGYAVLASLALWTLYYSAFALLALNLFALPWLWRRARSKLPAWMLAQAGALALYLPWLPIALRQALDPPVPPWRQALPLGELLGQVLRESSTALPFGQSLDPGRWWPLGMLAVLIALLAFRQRHKRATALLWASLLGPLALLLIASQFFSPLYHVRYLALYSPVFPLLLAAGILELPRLGRSRRPVPLLSLLALLILLGGSALSLRNYYGDRPAYEAADDLRGAVQAIYERIGPRDAVLINAGYLYPAFLYYWPGEIGWLGRLGEVEEASPAGPGPVVALSGHVDGAAGIGWGDPESDFYAISRADTAAGLAALFAGHNTVWVLRGYDTVNDADGFIRGWLAEHGERYFDQVFPGQSFVRAQAWRTHPRPRLAAPEMEYPLAATFANGIRLLGYDSSPAALDPGRPLRLTLYWQARQAGERDWKVFVQLLDAGGEVATQDDARPGDGAFPTGDWQAGEIVESSYVLHPPVGLAPGVYRLITGFYDAAGGERLPLAAGGDSVTLARFELP